MTKELLEKLQLLGFKEYESKVFLVLLKGSLMSASEISQKAKVPRTSIYEILKSFAEKGYCNEIETNTILNYQMIDPKIIADKIERELQLLNKKKIAELQETFKELEPLFRSDVKKDDDKINVELIRGFNKHRYAKFLELFKEVKREVHFMVRLQGVISDELDNTAKNLLKKGGIIKSIYEVNLEFKIKKRNIVLSATLDELIKLCKSYEKYGEKLKLSTKELPNMTIFDREIVFIHIFDKNIPKHNNSDIIIKNEEFAKRMIDLFDHYWEESHTIDEFIKKQKLNLDAVISKN